MKKPEHVDQAAKLLSSYRELTAILARAPAGGFRLQVYLTDDDARCTCVYFPPTISRSGIACLRGLVHGRLLDLGVDADGTTDRECFECGATKKEADE